MLQFSKKLKKAQLKEGWYSDNYDQGNPEHKTGIDLSERKNQVKKIYDLAGNVWEWTMKSYNTEFRMYRGGVYYNSGADSPSSFRRKNRPYDSYGGDVGFRTTLFLKS